MSWWCPCFLVQALSALAAAITCSDATYIARAENGTHFSSSVIKKAGMTPEEIERFFPSVWEWIQQALAAHDRVARPLSSLHFPRLPRYFRPALIEATKTVVVDHVPIPPLSSMGLNRFKEFEAGDYDGITYLSTIFVKRPGDEELYFHEMIHVVQWQLLGAERFVVMYADGLETHGYRDSPLERMAYDAQDLFSRSQHIFDAEKFVAQKLFNP
jgi:hypothetical protein